MKNSIEQSKIYALLKIILNIKNMLWQSQNHYDERGDILKKLIRIVQYSLFVITLFLLVIIGIKHHYEKMVSKNFNSVSQIYICQVLDGKQMLQVDKYKDMKYIYNTLKKVNTKGHWIQTQESLTMMVDVYFEIHIVYRDGSKDIISAYGEGCRIYKELPVEYGYTAGKCDELYEYYFQTIKDISTE